MKNPFILFWAILIFTSIFWYGFLVIFIGVRAGRELRDLIKSLRTNRPDPGNGT